MMTVKEYLNRKNFEWREERGQAVMNCPFCGDTERKFAVNTVTGLWNCFHLNNCGLKGNFYDLQKKLGDEPERIASDGIFANKSRKSYKLPTATVNPITDACTEYMMSRGFNKECVKHFKLGAVKDRFISFPYYRGETLVNVKYRDIKEKKFWSEKEAEPILFNHNNVGGKVLILTEGEIDCMSLFMYGWEAASVPMGAKNYEWVDNEWEFLEQFKTIYLCLDVDGAGQEAAQYLAKKLGTWRCKNVRLPLKDVNECLLNGITKNQIEDCFRNATEYTPSLLASPWDFRESIQQLFADPDADNGTKTPWEKLDKILKGWREQELTIWSGRNSSGKSTIINQVIIDLAGKEIKSCIASLEMPAKRYLKWAIIQYLENSHPSAAAIDRALNYFHKHIKIINTAEETDASELLEVFEYAARRYDVKHFVIDSLMRVKLNQTEELKAQQGFVSNLVSFAKKFNCHMHLVAHPRKGMSDFDRPGKVDVKGSGHITDLAHNVLITFRPDDEEKQHATSKKKKVSDMLLYVKKNREFGIEGSIRMKFNPLTKRFTEEE